MNEINQINNEPVRKSRILLVDDEPGLRTAVKTFLEDEGFDIFIAVDGEDGWEKAQTVFPDLIISDIMMPRANGYALLEKIRALEFKTPVLYLMGEQDYMFLPFVKKIVNNHKSSSLVTIAGSGHVVNIDKSDQFNNSLLSHLLED